MDGTAVEVLGVPGNLLSPDRMIDKLTIHFLRPRNGGGEVLEVAFPTSSSRRAVVVFEMPEVAASVLQHIQVLEVEGQHFPLQVWRTDRPEFDMPVKATLDVTMFSSDDVWRLLKSHGFQVTGRGPGLLLVHGSFLKLRDVKAQLQQLLTRETHHSRHTPSETQPHHSRHTPSETQPHHSRHTPSQTQPHHSRHTPRVNSHASGLSGQHADQAVSGSHSPVHGEHFSSLLQSSPHSNSGSPHSLSRPERTNPSPDLQTPGPRSEVTQRTNPSPDLQTPGSELTQRTNPSPGLQTAGPGSNVTQRRKQFLRADEPDSHPPSRSTVTFVTEADVLSYALHLRKKEVNEILQRHSSEIVVTSVDNSDISSVVLDGKNPEKAMEELQSVLDLLTVTLRNQDIKLDDDNKSTVIKRIQKYKDIYPDVLVKQVRDILHLIGPSSGSYDMKQRLLGKTTEALPAGRTGRSTIPNSRDRRSSSVPRQTRRREDAPSACDPVISPATLQYPPSSYQNAPGCGRAGHTGEPTPPASSSRSRSSSESRSKAIDRKEKLKQEGGALEQRAAHRQDDVTNFPDGQKSKLSKMQLSFMKMTKTDIKNKFSRKPKIL